MPKKDFNNLQSTFIKITLQHGYSPVNLLHENNLLPVFCYSKKILQVYE